MEKHPERAGPATRPWLIGRVSALIDEVLPAKTIVDQMVNDAAKVLTANANKVKVSAKL